ncbi:MAG: BadF/BadG/BcrA/BcrD ATPase family protein [Steroidobacteraceae bacterium]
MRTCLGVDGGGTKTDFLLIDETGRVLATRREGSAYYLQIGLEALQSMLVAGIEDMLQHAGVAPASTYAFLGLPAYGENAALLSSLDRIAADVLPLERYRCGNDVVCGWAGALAGGDGINIVAGTGSIAYGEFASRSARAGGWGELFSDEGSAYWVARETLTLFSRMSDGRTPRGPLYDLIREHFAVSADLEVCAAIYGPPPLTRSEVSALAPIAAAAARDGDLAAGRIFETAAQELAAIVHAVRDKLGVPPQVRLPLSYSGGMCRPNSLLLPLLEATLQMSDRQYEFAAPRLSPIAGAVLCAAKSARTPLTPEAIAQLTRTHAAFTDAP